MNVYLRKLTRKSNGYWLVSGRVQVNDDPPPTAQTPIDEFLPEIWVTHESGQSAHVHVVFFSDRRFDEQIDNNPAYPKFDVYYARSETGGQSFTAIDDQRLYKYSATDPNDVPMIDYSRLPPYDPHQGPDEPYELNDYFGFTARMTTSGFQLWAAPHCSDGQIDPGHDSVVAASEIK